MKKLITSVIISLVVAVSSTAIETAAFCSNDLGAALIISNVMSNGKHDNDKKDSITIIDGSGKNIEFSFKLAELIKSIFG